MPRLTVHISESTNNSTFNIKMNMSTSQNKQKQQTLLARRPQYASSLVNSADCCSTAALLRYCADALLH